MATLFVYRSAQPKNLSFLTGLSVMLALLAGAVFFGVHHTSAASCTTNDIIRCGFSTPADFIGRVQANNNGLNNTNDLQAVYAHYGLTPAEYGDFAKHAVKGEAMADGRIVVNGRTVGTGGMSIGRLKSYQGSDPFAVRIGAHTYYGNVNSQAFAPGVREIPIYVLLDSRNGGFKFAVMPSCGNPEFPVSRPAPKPPAKPAAPQVWQSAASGMTLNGQPVHGQQNAYAFTTAGAQTGTTVPTRYVYDFGDGSPAHTMTNGYTPVTHTYTVPGSYSPNVTVYPIGSGSNTGATGQQSPTAVTYPGQVVVTQPQGSQVPQVSQVPASSAGTAGCGNLVGLQQANSGGLMTFTFVATAAPGSSLALNGADFDFGDGTLQQNSPANGDGATVSVNHTYTSPGTYTVGAVLHFVDLNDPNSFFTTPECTTTVTPTAVADPAVATTSTASPASPQPAATTPTSTSSTPSPVTATSAAAWSYNKPATAAAPAPAAAHTRVLPNTGAGDVVGLFLAVSSIGALVFRQFLLRRGAHGN